MSSRVVEIFEDERLVEKIKNRLPYLFQLAELESSRAGKIGMEVGSARERVIVALLIYKFGEENIGTDIPITAPEADVGVFEKLVSIKTITSGGFGGVKLIWTVDPQKAREFRKSYYPQCDILFAQINWNALGGFFYIPLKAQRELFDRIEKERYIKLPKLGTNPRGVEITEEALSALVVDGRTKRIDINWQRTEIAFNPYKKWVELWREE